MFKRIFWFIFPFIIVVGLYVFSHYTGYECIFRKYLHIHCGGCGLTRSIYYLIHLDIKKCLYYNILTFPLLFTFGYYETLAIKDIIKKENKLFDTFFAFLEKYFIIIILLVIASMLYENICQI